MCAHARAGRLGVGWGGGGGQPEQTTEQFVVHGVLFTVGDAVGTPDGNNVGRSVGRHDGTNDGSAVGVIDGGNVGDNVGTFVRAAQGIVGNLQTKPTMRDDIQRPGTPANIQQGTEAKIIHESGLNLRPQVRSRTHRGGRKRGRIGAVDDFDRWSDSRSDRR